MAADPPVEPAEAEKVAATPSSVAKQAPAEEIRAVARTYADQPLQNPDPGVWGVLTAISNNARQRPEGLNIIMNGDEHLIGRLVDDTRFRICAAPISSKHCRIYRDKVALGDDEVANDVPVPVFLKDTSTNGTYLNWNKLTKSSPEARLKHGDIIAFLHPPHSHRSYAFVYREVPKSICTNGASLKRKSEEFGSESKRLKGIGIGAPEGPVSLDDVRSLQRSNMDLRKQLESHVLTIETMRSEAQTSIACHENEMKKLKESVSNSYLDQTKELQHMLDGKHKELEEVNIMLAELRHSIKDLNERLSASMQSRVDADKIINSQKATISELEAQLDEERNQRKGERVKAAADLKSALQRAHSEAQEEINRQTSIYIQQHKEQQEVLSKLQESEKESRLFVEALRSKLDDTRESLVMSEKKVRQLEAQVQEEQITSANSRNRSEKMESEVRRLRKELQSEKVAREETWAKVSALELEIAAAMHELSIEKQRFQGARERIILRETQLRAFYSTTEEISALFAKQQEQLKAMQKTLEDEENYDNTFMGIDLNVNPTEDHTGALAREGKSSAHPNITNTATTEVPLFSTPTNVQAIDSSSSDDDASVTEKHDCDVRSREDDDDTQDLECTSADRSVKGFGSDIDGVGTAPVPEGDPADTERVRETEISAIDVCFNEQNTALHKCSNLAGDTLQVDNDAQVQENLEHTQRLEDGNRRCSQSRREDTETGMVRTTDLLASEGPGSWANSTAPSVHGENESPRSGGIASPTSDDNGVAAALLCLSDGQAAGSQSNVAVLGVARLSEEHRALNAMIEIVDPNFKESDSMSDAETEEGSNQNSDKDDDGSGDSVEGDDVMIEDSVE